MKVAIVLLRDMSFTFQCHLYNVANNYWNDNSALLLRLPKGDEAGTENPLAWFAEDEWNHSPVLYWNMLLVHTANSVPSSGQVGYVSGKYSLF